MKSLFAIILFSALSFTGCYTVLWTPDQDLPTEETYYGGGYGYDDGYYSDPYYGGYGYYYEYPWWLTMAPPTRSGGVTNEKSERYESIREIRKSGSDRNSDDNPRLSSPTRSSNSGSTTSSSSGNSTQSTETKRSDSGNNNSGDRTNTRNTGERNSGGGRK